MNKLPLISIIIPTYNRADIIDKTLNSIIAQTYENWECIVVDDGSSDNTSKILKHFLENDNRFQFYQRPENLKKGPSVCRNFGYERSKGEYIHWFDSDDLMHPDKLKIKLECAIKYQADVIVDGHSESDTFTNINDFNVDCFITDDFYIDFILGKKPVITNDVMLKSTIIKEERFDENLWKGEEYEFYSRIFQQKLTYCFLEAPLTCYRISPDSISISPKQTESLIYLSKILIKRHENQPLLIANAERQGRKTYKSLVKKEKIGLILEHFKFFRNSHKKSILVFSFFLLYNLITKRGFDRIKPN